MYNNHVSRNNSWCLNPLNKVHWAEWKNSDESVLYIESTGQTVLVSLLTISILELLAQKAQNISSLSHDISSLAEEDIEPLELRAAILNILTQLQQFGAIELCRH